MSNPERVAWVSLLVSVLIGSWYFTQVFGLPGDAPLLGFGMMAFTVAIVFVAIVAAIVTEVVMRSVQRHSGGDPTRHERLDERDRLINLRAGRNAYVVLMGGGAFLVGLIMMTQWLRSAWGLNPVFRHDTVLARMLVGPLSAPLLMQWLLLLMTGADLTKYLTRIVSYRRGY